MNKLRESLLECVNTLVDIDVACNNFKNDPNDVNGDKIISLFEEIEKKVLTLRDNTATMVSEIAKNESDEEENNEVLGIKSDNGFLLESDKEKI